MKTKIIKLGDKITVTEKYIRSYRSLRDDTKCTWALKPIKPTEGIVCGIRVIADGIMGKEGFYFEKTIKVYLVAINLKSAFYIPIK